MFHTQGAVPLASNAYVEREFENAVLREISASRWVLLLGPRQHGKSTGLVRVKKTLAEAGLVVTNADFQAMPPCASYQDLLRWFSTEVARRLGIVCPYLPEDGDGESLLSWLNTIFTTIAGPIVVIVDEAASIDNAAYRNSFYGQIREISSLRAEGVAELSSRLRFIFAGTFRPETLVQEQNSPFNVCQTIYTEDLTAEKARQLVEAIAPNLAELSDQAFDYVGGQPFLLQTVFKRLNDADDEDKRQTLTDILQELKFDLDAHIVSIFGKIITTPSLAQKVSSLATHNEIPVVPGDTDFNYLQVLGVAKRSGARLIFRNQLYADIARNSPQLLPEAATRPVTTVYPLTAADFDFMTDQDLAAIALSSYDGAANCHNAGNYRLALVGFGSAMEAVLLDFLRALRRQDLQTAITAANRTREHRAHFQQHEHANNPATWRLVNLINVARCAQVGAAAPEPTHALREWRNLVHPALAAAMSSDESRLAPESAAAAAILAILNRDLAEIAGGS